MWSASLFFFISATLGLAPKIIKDQYIVVVDQSFSRTVFQGVGTNEASHIWGNIEVTSWFDFGTFDARSDDDDDVNEKSAEVLLGGFVARIESQDILEQIKKMPGVVHVEEDQVVYASASVGRSNDDNAKLMKQFNATWNLARISSHKLPSENTYMYSKSAGKGVDVYVVDTGVDVTNPEFEGRATWGKTIPKFSDDSDGNGHGTHCAGIVGSKTFGVAKKAKIHAVKVLRADGSGAISDVIGGIEFVVKEHKRLKLLDDTQKTVLSMSLGGGKSTVINNAVKAAYNAGIHVVVAAGNEYSDACLSSPSSSPYAITVGATTEDDELADFSNYGSCVDILAGGKKIESLWLGKTKTRILDGTSMATPQVSGKFVTCLRLIF